MDVYSNMEYQNTHTCDRLNDSKNELLNPEYLFSDTPMTIVKMLTVRFTASYEHIEILGIGEVSAFG